MPIARTVRAERLKISFTGKVWLYAGKGAWHFITLPPEAATQIRFFKGGAPGFGMVKVKARIGGTAWTTSVFPDGKTKSYLLPLKAAVRKAEQLRDGSRVQVSLSLAV